MNLGYFASWVSSIFEELWNAKKLCMKIENDCLGIEKNNFHAFLGLLRPGTKPEIFILGFSTLQNLWSYNNITAVSSSSNWSKQKNKNKELVEKSIHRFNKPLNLLQNELRSKLLAKNPNWITNSSSKFFFSSTSQITHLLLCSPHRWRS